MKKLLIICLFFASCTKSIESSVRDAVEKDVKLSLNDPKSYEPLQWSKVDTMYLDSAKTQKGYAVVHSFRCKNSFNATVENEQVFQLDQNFNILFKEKY